MLFLFEVTKYLNNHWKRLSVITGILILTAIFSKKNVYVLLELYDLVPEGAILTVQDYLVGLFNSAQFVMFFIFPVLFAVLIADLITVDFDDGFIHMILARAESRFHYIITKCGVILMMAVLFTCLVIATALLVATVFRIPFSGDRYHYLFLADHNASSLFIYFIILSSFILGLTFIGMLTLVLSVYTRGAGVAVGVMILLGFIHNVFYVIDSPFLLWLPFTQYVVGIHEAYAPFGIPVSYFTSAFSSLYLLIGIIFTFGLLMGKMRSCDINRVRSSE
ncbi:ABC transporter permease [Lederbergia sp. NSJ-179]|uniref:ABC transporter permease n=1 Tax=Lederbergia sp. NSJ-179 TaxID=2931402 RepID=UPI001FD0D364|nr:ABC transporter permease [Lederbergia sp. NSJ-179]MCJ7841736.1 ABC transporter permease [Lederbergia sp. NSJ-179]